MQEAGKLLNNLLTKQKINTEILTRTLSQITPSLDSNAVRASQVVIEAVVEKQEVKQQVLRELEEITATDAILTSNTSTIPISSLAKALSRPQQFCGMHFFNPVHKMPLVEVIRGEETSQTTIDTVVALAASMRKTPIVVKDCPGFFVNRVLFPYLFALGKLVDEGVDYHFIDKVMEKQFGWPMGPAYLLDVIGIDTAKHAGAVMAEGFPERMGGSRFNAVETLLESNCLGQKNSLGFYRYIPDKKGKPKKTPHPEIQQKLYRGTPSVIDADTVIARMMIPMLNEVARCLDEGIVDTPAQADMALIYGLGFPPFRGGACRYIDHTGVDHYLKLTERFGSLGPMYTPGEGLTTMARKNDSFYPDSVKGV